MRSSSTRTNTIYVLRRTNQSNSNKTIYVSVSIKTVSHILGEIHYSHRIYFDICHLSEKLIWDQLVLIPHSVITTGDKNLLYYFHKLLITYLCVYLSSFVGCLLFGARKSHHHRFQNCRYCCRCRVPITALPCWNKLITCFCLGLARYLRCKSLL